MGMHVRKMNIGVDNIDFIIELLFETKVRKLPFRFDDIDEAKDVIKNLLHEKGTEYDADNFLVCIEDGKIIGVSQMYDPTKINVKKALSVYKSLGSSRKFHNTYPKWREVTKPLQNASRTMYIHNIAYSDETREKEIGSAIMLYIIPELKKDNYTHIHTDIRLSSTRMIEKLKSEGFMAIRVINDDFFKEPMVRMTKSLY